MHPVADRARYKHTAGAGVDCKTVWRKAHVARRPVQLLTEYEEVGDVL